MISKFKIRLACDKDYVELARLHRQTIRKVNSKDYPQDIVHVWSGRTNAQRFRESASKCKRWVAIKNNKIIGFCDHNFKCELWGLYIHKDFVDQGIGSDLLREAEKSLKKQGCKRIKIKSTITAKNFYQKNGYEVIKKGFHKIENKKMLIYFMRKNISV